MEEMVQNGQLRVSLVQYDIAWENKQKNLDHIKKIASQLEGQTDLLVLPEMCTTGFSMNSHNLAEPIEGQTIFALKKYARDYDMAICGSYIAEDSGNYYNRGFFITAENAYYYDKHHLFRMGSEPQHFSAGEGKRIIEYKGLNICLLICYDLRFPVWARNVENEYDLLIYTANWPASRAKVWNALLIARAIENMSYVCGVNRIGIDGNGLQHQGESKLIDAKGNEIITLGMNQNEVKTVIISKSELEQFRTKFPAWKDADKFRII